MAQYIIIQRSATCLCIMIYPDLYNAISLIIMKELFILKDHCFVYDLHLNHLKYNTSVKEKNYYNFIDTSLVFSSA